MLKKEVLIGMLVALFCLGLTGIALAEVGEETHLYERALHQTTDNIDHMQTEQGKVTSGNKMHDEQMDSIHGQCVTNVLSTSNVGTTSEPYEDDLAGHCS
jgi:hypothetical protein